MAPSVIFHTVTAPIDTDHRLAEPTTIAEVCPFCGPQIDYERSLIIWLL